MPLLRLTRSLAPLSQVPYQLCGVRSCTMADTWSAKEETGWGTPVQRGRFTQSWPCAPSAVHEGSHVAVKPHRRVFAWRQQADEGLIRRRPQQRALQIQGHALHKVLTQCLS